MKLLASVCWFCANNLEKAIVDASFLEKKILKLKPIIRVNLIIFDRTNKEFEKKENIIKLSPIRYKVISKRDTPHQLEYLKLESFSYSRYILPLTDDDQLDYDGLIDFIAQLDIKIKSSIIIAIPEVNKTGIDLGNLKPNNNYDFWEYQSLRSYNIAYWSAISTSELLIACKSFEILRNSYWLHPFWDQCLVWAITHYRKKSIKVIEGFYLKYDLGKNWSNKSKSLKTINSMTPNCFTTEGLAIRDILTYKEIFSINIKEYLRWFIFLLKRNWYYRKSILALIKSFLSIIKVTLKQIRLNL